MTPTTIGSEQLICVSSEHVAHDTRLAARTPRAFFESDKNQ